MAKRRGRRVNTIPLVIGNDPELWRFDSMQEALEAGTGLISRLIRDGEELERIDETDADVSVSSSESERT